MHNFHKKIFGSGITTTKASNWEMIDIMKVIKPLEESGKLIKAVSQTIQNEAKELKGVFNSMVLCTLKVSLLSNLLEGKDTIRAGEGTDKLG